MKQKILFITIAILITSGLFAQTGIQNDGANIKISQGASIKLAGSGANYANLEGGTVELDGTIELSGDWLNTSSSNQVFINLNGIGKVKFLGSSVQSIGGSYSTYFENLYLNNSSGITLGAAVEVDSLLSFTSTILDLDAYDLRIDEITNLQGSFGVTNMIVSNNGGYFKFRPKLNTYNIIPLGDNYGTNEFSRLYLYPYGTTTFGSNAQYSVRVENAKHPNNASTPDYLNRYWQVQSNDINNQQTRIYAFYTDADINGSELNLVPGQYIDPFWTQGYYVYASSNYLYYYNLSTMGDFTAGQADKFNVSIAIENETIINEGSENGDSILVTLTNGSFVSNPNVANWDVYNLQNGVSLGSVSYIDETHVRLILSGDRLQDFDSDITNIEVSVNSADVNNLNSGSITASSGVTITCANDPESLSFSYDGTITEGSESGETISVILSGGTFTDPIVSSNWTLNNLPSGVTYSLSRIDESTVDINLLTNTNIDYDIDITNFEVIVSESEINDHTGSDLSVNSGVNFTAIVEAFTISMGMVDAPINEGAEDGEIIGIKITGDTFVSSLTDSNWSVNNLPEGVTWVSTINRIADDSVQITLSGNRTRDYDANISNISVTINPNEVSVYTNPIIVSSGVTLTATNDAESLILTSVPINEGSEDGAIISVELAGGTFYSSPDKTKWSVSNLPTGVTIGSVNYIKSDSVIIVLSGSATLDYDSNRDFNLSVDKSQLADISTSVSGAGQIQFTADNDDEYIEIAATINEGEEDGSSITVNLFNGTFYSTIQTSNVTVTNLPGGVSVSGVTYQSPTQITLALLGNTNTDYDSNIEDATVTIAAAAYSDSTGNGDLSASTGVVFVADDELVTLSLNAEAIYESYEDGAEIYVNLSQDIWAATIDATNCQINNLPTGVSASYSRESDEQVLITLSGNREIDFDADIDSIYVSVLASALDQHDYDVISDSLTISATNDAEILSLVSQTITEQAEDGAVVTVVLSGGTFAASLNDLNWMLSSGPDGVAIGSLNRISSDTVEVTLSNNATSDYDQDIDLEFTIDDSEVDDYNGGLISLSGDVVFEAVLEPIALIMANNGTITEGSEDGGEIIVTVSNDQYINELQKTEWEVVNLPSGVTVDTILRQDDTHAIIVLAGTSLVDYDSPIDTVHVTVKGTQFQTQSVDFLLTSGVTLSAIDDAESIYFTSVSITERTENGAIIEINLDGGTFVSSLDINEWTISGQPTGISLGGVTRMSATAATITLSGNSTIDYDSDITGFAIAIGATQVDDYPEVNGDLTANSGVTFSAIDESVTYDIALGTLTESNVNESQITLTLVGDEFVDFGLDAANFTLNNAPAGVSIGALEYVDPTTANVMLVYDRTDFDDDYNTVSITVDGAEIMSGSSLTTSQFSIIAEIELPYIYLSDNGIYEGLEDLGFITVSLYEDVFKAVLTPANWIISNLPEGVAVKTYQRVDSVTVNLLLEGRRASDYDQDLPNVSVYISNLELVDGITDVSASSGVVFIATNDPEEITFTPIEIVEGAESGNTLTLNLTGGTFTSVLNTANWTFTNLPSGVIASNVQRVDSATVTFQLSGNANVDYDSDISDFTVIIPSSDVDDVSTGNITINQGVVFVSNNELLTTLDDQITEETLDGFVATFSLTDEAFLDTDLSLGSFSLVNAPANLSISDVSYVNDTAVLVTLAYDGSDFDSDYNMMLQIAANELYGKADLQSNTVGIVATNDDEVLSLAMDVDGILERSESGEFIDVDITGGTFVNPLDEAEWTIQNLPVGITYALHYIDLHQVQIELLSNSTEDYDLDITNLSVEVPSSDIMEYSGLNKVVTGSVVFTALDEQLALSGSLSETTLNGATLLLNLTDDAFADAVLDAGNFTLNNAPDGLSIQSVTYISETEASLQLAFESIDFDFDIADFFVTVNSNELQGVSDLESNVLTITAIVEVEDIEITSSELTEENLNNAQIDLKTKYVKFADTQLDKANFVLNNEPLGCDIQSVTYLTDSTATLILNYNGADFDTDKAISVTVNGAELTIASSITSNTINVTATFDIEVVSIENDGEILEANENGELLMIKIEGGNFIESPNFGGWELINLPNGVTGQNFILENDTLVSLSLSGARLDDFDTDQRINVSIPASDINESSEDVNSTFGFDIIALNDPETLTMADDGEIIEGTEDGEQISVTLSGGTFSSDAKYGGFEFTNLPSGIQIGSITYNSSTSITLTLSGNATSDYDEDIFAVLEIQSDIINDYSGANYQITEGVTLLGTYELEDRELLVASDGISESNLSGYALGILLNHESFTDATLDAASFTLVNAPAGVAVQSANYVSDTEANLILSFDGTDFDVNITDCYLEIAGTELASGAILSSNYFTIEAIDETPSLTIDHLGLTELNLDGATIDISLEFESFADGDVLTSAISLNNAPAGTTVASFQYLTSTTGILTLGFDGTDFDVDINNFYVTIDGSELTSGSLLESNNLPIIAANEDGSVLVSASEKLTETNINGALMQLDVIGETFADNTLDASNFILLNAPNGLSVQGVTYNSTNQANLQLAFDGTDFDINYNSMQVQVGGAELTNALDLTSNALKISAVDDMESLMLEIPVAIIEGNEEGSEIIVNISGGTFVEELDKNLWHLSNKPSGVDVDTVYRVALTQVVVVLKGSSGTDYDSDIAFTISVGESQFDDYSGVNLSTENSGVFAAVVEQPAVIISGPGLNEENLDGGIFDVYLNETQFITSVISVNDFTILDAPIGVKISSVIYLSAQNAKIELSYDGPDFDSDYFMKINVNNQILTENEDIESDTLLLTATNDPEIFTMTDDGEIIEMSEDGEVIQITIAGGQFAATLHLTDWVFSNLPEGVSVGAIEYISPAQVNLHLMGNTTADYDTNLTQFAVQIPPTDFYDAGGVPAEVKGGVTFIAQQENVSLLVTHSGLTEENLNGALLNLSLTNAKIISVTEPISFIVLNFAPIGTSVSVFNRLTDSTATITLAFDGSDFDTDITNFSITLEKDLLTVNESATSNDLNITATWEPEVLVDYDGEIQEGYENGESIQISLLHGNFNDNLVIDSISFTNLPQGVVPGNLVKVSDTLATIELLGNRTEDYDVNISSVMATINSGVFAGYAGNPIESATPIVFKAFDELLSISSVNTLNEGNLNGAHLSLELTDDVFIDPELSVSQITLYNAPIGVWVDSLNYVSDNQATLVLGFDGTDFTEDYDNFSVSLPPQILHGVNELYSNPLVIYEGVSILDENSWNIKIFTTFAKVFIEIDNLQNRWDNADVSIFDMNGKKVYNAPLQQVKTNIIELNVKTGYYFVNVSIDGTEFVNKVFILPE